MNVRDNANQEFIYNVVTGTNGSFTISASSPTTWSAELIYTNKHYKKASVSVFEVLSLSEALQSIRDQYEAEVYL